MSKDVMHKFFRTATLALAVVGAVAAVVAFANRMSDGVIPAHAQAVPPAVWTAVGSTGAVDEGSLGRFAFTNASAGYLPATASVDPLEFRYNVTNTFDNNANPNIPGWTALQLGAVAPGNSLVTAQLYRVDPCTGAQTVICQTRVAGTAGGTCTKCTFAANAVDFGLANYYVRVVVDRSVLAENPLLHTLRIQ